jgi:ABC-type transporter MlaC component
MRARLSFVLLGLITPAHAAPAAPSAPASVAAAVPSAEAAKARTTALIAAFVAVQRPAEGAALTPAQVKANAAVFARLDGMLHRERLLAGALGPHAKALPADARAKYDTDFWWLLRRIAYPDSGAFFERATHAIQSTAPRADGVDVRVHAELAEEDLETDITLHWTQIEGALWLTDVSFDGASLVLDYQNQFGRILAKKGAAGLLETLAAQRAKLEKVP